MFQWTVVLINALPGLDTVTRVSQNIIIMAACRGISQIMGSFLHGSNIFTPKQEIINGKSWLSLKATAVR